MKDRSKTPSDEELKDEAVLFVNAGTDTASDAFINGSIHLLDNRPVLVKLQEELDKAWPILEQVPRFEELEKLPYLVGFDLPDSCDYLLNTRRRPRSSKNH